MVELSLVIYVKVYLLWTQNLTHETALVARIEFDSTGIVLYAYYKRHL